MEFSEPSYPVVKTVYENAKALCQQQLDKHSKVLIVRADFRYPQGYIQEDNKAISDCMRATMQSLKRKGYDPAYLTVTESSHDGGIHHHSVFMVNGHKMRHPEKIYAIANEHWKRCLHTDNNGLIDHCHRSKNGTYHKNYVMIERNKPLPPEVAPMLEYPAKPMGKADIKGKGLRTFGMSRLKKSK